MKLAKLSVNELKDFRVPIEVFKSYSLLVKKTRPSLRNRLLKAAGIDTDNKNTKISWENYLTLNLLMDPHCQDKEALRQFAVRLFDPTVSNSVSAEEFERSFREIFASETDLLPIQGSDSSELKDENSVAEALLRDLLASGVYQKSSYLKTDKLYEAIVAGLIDLDSII